MYWFSLGDDRIERSNSLPRSDVLTNDDLDQTLAMLCEAGPGIDTCELCGGCARPTTIAIRRKLRTGRNFDIVTNCDLGVPRIQKLVTKYILENDVLVVIMAPSCRTMGPTSNVNAAINHDTWLRHYNEDAPHIRFCGFIAKLQIRRGCFFFAENPHPTYMLKEGDWTTVAQHKDTLIQVVDQCALGAKGPNGLPVKKPTMLITNAPEIYQMFAELRCNGKHQHDQTWGAGTLSQLQVWPWMFAERLIEGIVRLKKRIRKASAYPETGSGPQGPDQPKAEFQWNKCPGCKGRMARTRREHTRILGECRYDDVIPEMEWTCPGCSRNPARLRGHQDHTEVPGDCRWAITGTRLVTGRARGSHPREAPVRASQDANNDIPGPDLNPITNTDPVAPEDVEDIGEEEPQEQAAASSSHRAHGDLTLIPGKANHKSLKGQLDKIRPTGPHSTCPSPSRF